MEIIYASVQCSEKKFIELFSQSNEMPGQQIQKYNRLFAEGFTSLNGVNVLAVTSLPVSKKNYPRKIIRKSFEKVNGINYYYLPSINIHRIQDMLTVFFSFSTIFKLLYKNKKAIIIVDILNAPVALGAIWAGKLFRRKRIGIITDVPNILFENSDTVYRITSNYVIKRCTEYVFLTEQMDALINQGQKPYVVIEGLVDQTEEMKSSSKPGKYPQKVCMYTGGLQRIYGIPYLIDAFIRADIPNAELHIYGRGDYQTEIEKISKEFPQIKYYGEKENAYIVEEQKKATLLINPRPTDAEYTKYSFPSKNMEYMVSGTPVLTTLLPGMPEEYKEYVYSIENETVDSLAKTLQEVLSKPEGELWKMGQNARQFVLREKNNYKQAERMAKELRLY